MLIEKVRFLYFVLNIFYFYTGVVVKIVCSKSVGRGNSLSPSLCRLSCPGRGVLCS